MPEHDEPGAPEECSHPVSDKATGWTCPVCGKNTEKPKSWRLGVEDKVVDGESK